MAKTIKFNLILDGNSIRDIDDLKENFSIEDILLSYRSQLLQKWLKVRGYNEYLDKVNKIVAEDSTKVLSELINIFEVEVDQNKIREGLTIIQFTNERQMLLEEYRKSNYEVQLIIDDYHSDYSALIMNIIENKDDMAKIKANIKEIEQNFMGLFNLNYVDLFNNFLEHAPLAIFAILMNERMRDYFIANEDSNPNVQYIYGKLKSFINSKVNLKEKLGEELKVFKGNTAAYWKDIESKEKKYMIIKMENGNFIRNAGKFGEELSNKDVCELFKILDGIDYKSNNAKHELIYMEV